MLSSKCVLETAFFIIIIQNPQRYNWNLLHEASTYELRSELKEFFYSISSFCKIFLILWHKMTNLVLSLNYRQVYFNEFKALGLFAVEEQQQKVMGWD